MKNSLFKIINLLIFPLGIYCYTLPRIESIKATIIHVIGIDKLSHLHFLVAVLNLWTIIAIIYLIFNIKRNFMNPILRLYNSALVFTLIALAIMPMAELILFNGATNHFSAFSVLYHFSKFSTLVFLPIAVKKGQVNIPNSCQKLITILYLWLVLSAIGVTAYLLSLKW